MLEGLEKQVAFLVEKYQISDLPREQKFEYWKGYKENQALLLKNHLNQDSALSNLITDPKHMVYFPPIDFLPL